MNQPEGPPDAPTDPPPAGQPPPNWGSAYPPPGQYPPPPQYPTAGPYPPGYGQPYYGQPPRHPQATTAMVLGITGLTGLMFCLTFVVAPAAWIVGAKTVKAIDASGGAYSGRSDANAGRIMGIIGTVLLILVLALVVLLVVLTFTVDNFWEDSSSGDGSYEFGSLAGMS